MDYKEKYEKAFDEARVIHKCGNAQVKQIIEQIFPELAESEDDRIRKEIISWLKTIKFPLIESAEKAAELVAWLEKQGEPLESCDDDILQRFSFYSYKDEPNIIYLSELYVSANHRNKGIGTKILTIADEVATSMGCNVIRLKTEIGSTAERLYRRNGYNTFKIQGNQVWLDKQVQKLAEWSEKDERIYQSIIDDTVQENQLNNEQINWLKFRNKE